MDYIGLFDVHNTGELEGNPEKAVNNRINNINGHLLTAQAFKEKNKWSKVVIPINDVINNNYNKNDNFNENNDKSLYGDVANISSYDVLEHNNANLNSHNLYRPLVSNWV